MKAFAFLSLLALVLAPGGALACPPGYYCGESYGPGGYYSYEAWDGYVNWQYVSPDARIYSYYGPSYYGNYYYPNYYGYSYYGSYDPNSYAGYYNPNYYQYNYYNYPPIVYYHAPYYGYYDYGSYYYTPGFSVSMRW